MNPVLQCVVITGIGVLFLIFSGRRVFLAARSWSWPQIEGTVVNSYVMLTASNPGAGRGTRQTTYLVVEYRYTVGGKTYESKRWGFDDRHPKYGSRSPVSGKLMWHESELLAAYPDGAPITVYYDPRKPESSVITRKVGLITYLFLLLGVSLVFVGAAPLMASVTLK